MKSIVIGLLARGINAALGNTIDLDLRGNHDYNGPIYLGKEYRENHLIYDTMSDWTVIIDGNAKGLSLESNYYVAESTTAQPMYFNKDTVESAYIDLGSVKFNGKKYREQICLE